MQTPLFSALLIASLAGAIISDATASTLNWGSDVGSSLMDSEGEVLDETFVFELGAFQDNFVPDESNIDQWSLNWLVFDRASYNPILGYFTSSVQISTDGKSASEFAEPDSPSFNGKSMYLWIKNNAGTQPGTEWMLSRNASWTFSVNTTECCDNSLPMEWSVSDLDENDVPVWGAQNGIPGAGESSAPGNYTLQTYTVVPEPTAITLVGVAIGLGMMRRRRPN
jgi:hypothetical protein